MLTRRCYKSLKFLDIESSKGIRDDGEGKSSTNLSSLTSLTKLEALEEMNLFDKIIESIDLKHLEFS